ncbi:MAG: sodium:solute symporter, partial [Bacteroidetes bacterium]|nr:sodium:solute symporter [Bacteroidota bacterium]
PDVFFPLLAMEQLGTLATLCVVVGLVAAAYNSADGTLTALTTSYCVDILKLEEDHPNALRRRHRVQLVVALAYLGTILLFYYSNRWLGESVPAIDMALGLAGYTYGPLLGMFAFGLFTRYGVADKYVPWLCLAVPLLCWLVSRASAAYLGYNFGFELLLLNGLLVFAGLWLLRKPRVPVPIPS